MDVCLLCVLCVLFCVVCCVCFVLCVVCYVFCVVCCVCCVLCAVKERSLRRADHLSRGVLTSVVCLCEALVMRSWPFRGCCAM